MEKIWEIYRKKQIDEFTIFCIHIFKLHYQVKMHVEKDICDVDKVSTIRSLFNRLISMLSNIIKLNKKDINPFADQLYGRIENISNRMYQTSTNKAYIDALNTLEVTIHAMLVAMKIDIIQ